MDKLAEQSSIESSSIEPSPRLFIIMGVSGTGKSSLAKQLADELSITYLDADNFHSAEAKKQMAANKPLTDELRAPWLATIIAHLHLQHRQGKSIALAYSGLKSAHRQLFRALPFTNHFFYLAGGKAVIAERISRRESHFFSAELLNSQFEAMQAPSLSEQDVSTINIERPYLSVVDEINNLAQLITRKLNNG